MKIVDVKVHLLQSPLAQPFAFSQGWVRRRSATLVEVLTDAVVKAPAQVASAEQPADNSQDEDA